MPEYVESDNDLYPSCLLALSDQLELGLSVNNELGLLMADARSDLHFEHTRSTVNSMPFANGSVLDSGQTHFVEPPWFGFSAFYGGLQLADFAAYFVDFVSNETERAERDNELRASFRIIVSKVNLIRIP